MRQRGRKEKCVEERERPERERLLKAREMMANYVGSNERERERDDGI